MKAKCRRWILTSALAAACLLGLWILAEAPSLKAQSQQDGQQPPASSGPKSNPGETVLIPKKTPPKPPPTESKPEKINPNDIYTLSTSTNLVNVGVLVTDKDGDPIPGLRKGNFRVYDDGVEQAISNFGIAKVPMTITMLIEFSSQYWQFLYLALEYSHQFVRYMQPQDWVAVIDFDMKPHILTDFTHDPGQVDGALNTLHYPEFSEVNLYDALAFTLDRMKNIQGRKAILLIATGCDSFSKLTYGDALKIVKASDTVIYPVSIYEMLTVRYGNNVPCGPGMPGYGASMNPLQARNALQTFAQYTGGQAYFPRFEGELPGIYQQIDGQLRTQYSLGFVPTNPTRDGRFHKLRVDLVGPQGQPLKIVNQKGKKVKYRVVARDGYYAPKS
jgi:VWFA-related protein